MKTMIGQTVSLDSITNSRSSQWLKDNQNIQGKGYAHMRIAALQEDLLFLSQILQENLRAEVPSGELFRVKCAVKNDQLMILTQHPKSVTPNTDKIFTVIGEVLKSGSAHQTHKVQMYLREVGEKLPYAQSVLIFGLEVASKSSTISDDEIPNRANQSHDFTPEASTYLQNSEELNVSSTSPLTITADVVEEGFDPFAGIPASVRASKLARNHKPILGGITAILVMVIFGGGAYLLMTPYIMQACKELQTAKELHNSLPQLARNINSDLELTQLQQQVNNAIASLQTIPSWSPQQSQAQQMKASLLSESQLIEQVTMALQTGATAQKARSLTTNIQELQARQQLWRQAIALLEAIRPNSQFYGFAQSKLTTYRSALQSVNVQLQAQGKWQQKLNDAQAAAKVARQRELTAKTLPELQKAQTTWQIVVNALVVIPQTSPAYPEAQKQLANYQPRLIAIRDRTSKIELAGTTVTQAVTTAKLAEQYQLQNQWQAAAIRWQQALNIIKQVPNDSPFYSQAQPLIETYSVSFQQAQAQSQTMTANTSIDTTRQDLEKTCTASVRVCNFTVDSRVITVRITPQYEQTVQSNIKTVRSVTKHLETLQQALEIIGDNANLAVLVFDAQGQTIFTHIPRRKY